MCLFERCDSSCCRPGCRSRSRRPSLLSHSAESCPTAVRCVALVRVAGTSAPCCLSRRGTACPGRARYFQWCSRVRGPPVSGSCRRRSRQSEVRGRLSFRVTESPRSRISGPLAIRRDGAVCRAAPAMALPGPLAACPRLRPAWVLLVAPVVSTLGGSWAASRASN